MDSPAPRAPREDPDAEAALLGALLLAAREVFPIVRPLVEVTDFSRAHHKLIYQAMIRLARRDEEIDFQTVASELDLEHEAWGLSTTDAENVAAGTMPTPLSQIGGRAYLVKLMGETPTIGHAEAYARRVRYIGTARALLGAASEIARIALVRDTGSDADLTAAALATLERIVMRTAGGGKILTSEEATHAYYWTLTQRIDGDESVTGFPLGFPDLDRFIAYRAGELWYVAAEPGTGKTALLGSFCDLLGMARVPSLFISIEQPMPQLMDRVVANEADIDSWRLAKGKIDAMELARVGTTLEQIAKRPIVYVEDGGMTTLEIEALVQLAVAKYQVKVVFVDYVQLIAMNEKRAGVSLVEAMAAASGGLRRIARKHNVCVVSASQLSRAGELRWAAELDQDAAVILRLAREKHSDQATVKIQKNRNGQGGIEVRMFFDRESAHFLPYRKPAPTMAPREVPV